MNLLHDSADPDDPIVTSALLWLIFPVAMSIEIWRSARLRQPKATTARYTADRSRTASNV